MSEYTRRLGIVGLGLCCSLGLAACGGGSTDLEELSRDSYTDIGPWVNDHELFMKFDDDGAIPASIQVKPQASLELAELALEDQIHENERIFKSMFKNHWVNTVSCTPDEMPEVQKPAMDGYERRYFSCHVTLSPKTNQPN